MDQTKNSHVEGECAPFKYTLVEDVSSEVEDLRNYIPGGYHPVAIGDLLGDGGRFRVVHKLGHGGYGTVWLCHDKTSKKWRAVKVMTAGSSTLDCADLRALELFNGIDPETLAANHIQLAIEQFWIDGPNGRHLCFVLPLLATNVADVYSFYGHLPELLKDICIQLVEAMMFMHSHNLCHGDFRPDNILFQLADGVDEWEEEALMKFLGQPQRIPVKPIEEETNPNTETAVDPGVPAYLVLRTNIDYGTGICSRKIAVIDFGVSYHASRPPIGKGTGIPIPFAPPEEIFEEDHLLGFKSDIWALGCTIAKVRLGYTPFACEYDYLLQGIEKLESIMGPMPHPYRTVWRKWNGVFRNSQDDDDEGWKDESVYATWFTDEYENLYNTRVGEVGAGNYLEYRMNLELKMAIDHNEAADIAAQAQSHPDRLPTYASLSEGNELTFAQQVKYKMDKAEIEQVFDLLLTIFKWHPEKRATLDGILGHEWFGRRDPSRALDNRRRSIKRQNFKKAKRSLINKVAKR